MPAKKAKQGARSPKAGRPPAESTGSPQAKRRQRSATVAVNKGTTLRQTDQGTKVVWGANQRRKGKI